MANHATRAKARVALITCRDLADLEDDDRLVIAPLNARGVAAEPVVWDDPTVDWALYDLAVLRSPWDYARRRDEFVRWAASVPALANPAAVVEWNTDKRYLASLAAAGVPVVPTTWVEPGEQVDLPTSGEWVIKPAISAGSVDTGRYDLSDPAHRPLASAHVARLSSAGRVTMLQPFLPAVDSYGETAMIYLGGRFSHAIRKGPMLDGPDLGVEGLYKEEVITARTPTVTEHAVADAVLAAAPGDLLYARVDLIPGPDGSPILVELELTEPSLFLAYADGAADRLAAAITRALPT
ncbi:hypothetical protein [Luedemannella helvata]|uniref:ATP-grasp domain-containing protein n=1 Tax=Luedemannella helvata TaxID=349315 RepID=UPI0031DB2EF5